MTEPPNPDRQPLWGTYTFRVDRCSLPRHILAWTGLVSHRTEVVDIRDIEDDVERYEFLESIGLG